MISNPSELIDGYLDDALTADQQAELSAWIKAKPENARIFAEAMLLHDRLRNTLGTDASEIASNLPREGRGGAYDDPTNSPIFTLPREGRGGACDDPTNSPIFTLPWEGRGGACDDEGRGVGEEEFKASILALPSPKSRSSTSTLPREGENTCIKSPRVRIETPRVRIETPRVRIETPMVCVEPARGWQGVSWSMNSVARTTAAAAVLVVGLLALWFTIGTPTASAAIRELDRIIVNSMRTKDRTFEIVVEDIATERRGRRSARPETQRPPKPPLDGATLYVRSGDQFVLKRKTQEGLPFITGSNGQQSWAVNPRGPVKVSDDVNEFNRDLPGHESSVPLTNLHEGLEQLKVAYDLTFAALGPEEYQAEDGHEMRQLIAVKKPKERGPQRVEIVYDGATGGILRMRFIQMPYGPDRLDLRLSLVSEDELPSDFFEHASHHALDRKVEVEN